MSTKYTGVTVAAIVLILLAPAMAGADLLISEMCDPRYNYTSDRFIEVYNAGANPVALAGWSLVAVGNGGDIFTWSLYGSIEPGEALVAGDQTTVVEFPVHFPDEAWSDSNGLWNGKIGDGAKLLGPSRVLIDYAVVEGTAFENADYVRRPNVTHPNTTYAAGEWTSASAEYPTDGSPGVHIANPPPAGPTIEDIHTDPARPMASETVDVIADVRDTMAALQSVEVSWGTTPYSLPNMISMELTSGDTYQTSTPIPGHSAGTSVYFQIEATNELLESRVSAVLHFPIPYPVTIHEIQGEGEESPYDNEIVVTSGMVTATFGAYFVVQDGIGAWEGLWVESAIAPSPGDQLSLWGTVDDGGGNTLLTTIQVLANNPGGTLPPAELLSTGVAATEPYEGVLVTIGDAQCTEIDAVSGSWVIDDGSGPLSVGTLGNDVMPTLGSRYGVTGPVAFADARFLIEPRDAGDFMWMGDEFAAVISSIIPEEQTRVRVIFSEAVEEVSAETEGHYSISDLTIFAAQRDLTFPEQVVLSVSPMLEGSYTLAISGVEDLFGNVTIGAEEDFDFADFGYPDGYYDEAAGLYGEDLQAALHDIIKDHADYDYSFVWTAFYTTDDKPNGNVWDIYSDIPGGIPPYEYTFGEDQGGVGGQEGMGYTREHSWPKSWFGGEVLPMYTDLFALYPTDAHVNGTRGVYPYGKVEYPTWTSLNGSELGPCSYAGYSGVVFEPIDAYKGDLARTYFYMGARYYSEDAGWPGSPMTDGAQLRPWALEMLLEWHVEDPVSGKELERNATVFGFQGNRNPFVDRPEFAELVYRTFSSIGLDGQTTRRERGEPILLPSILSPGSSCAAIRFELPSAQEITLELCDPGGRRVAELARGSFAAGLSAVLWDGRLQGGALAGSGVYFVRLRTPESSTTGRLLLLR